MSRSMAVPTSTKARSTSMAVPMTTAATTKMLAHLRLRAWNHTCLSTSTASLRFHIRTCDITRLQLPRQSRMAASYLTQVTQYTEDTLRNRPIWVRDRRLGTTCAEWGQTWVSRTAARALTKARKSTVMPICHSPRSTTRRTSKT